MELSPTVVERFLTFYYIIITPIIITLTLLLMILKGYQKFVWSHIEATITSFNLFYDDKNESDMHGGTINGQRRFIVYNGHIYR